MALDFPSPPLTDGQQHIEQGQVWTWNAAAGVWAVGDTTGQVTEIVEDDVDTGATGWFVAGDTLLQWGVGSGQNSDYVNYPISFEAGSRPSVTTALRRSSFAQRYHFINNIDEDRFQVLMYAASSGGQGFTLDWIAMGLAPEHLRKPKQILGGGAGSDVKIVNEGSGYQIVGGKMIAWGRAQTADTTGEITVTFPKAFAAPPSVSNTTELTTSGVMAQTGTPTETDVLLQTRHDSGAIADNIWCNWLAIGDCLPADIMPTSVIGNGVTEHHDPAGAGSWRQIGKTLECWGRVTGAAGTIAITFPKAFSSVPAVTGNIMTTDGGSAGFQYSVHFETATETGVSMYRMRQGAGDAAGTGYDAYWHAIGEAAD